MLGLLAGCDVFELEAFEPDVVVESYQVAGEDLKRVRLTWSVPIDQAYDAREQGISGATVRILKLDDEGGIIEAYSYREANSTPGVYTPEEAVSVLPKRTYRLEVEIEERSEMITAETTVPDMFEVVTAAESLTYEDPEASVTVTESRETDGKVGYVFTLTADDPRSEQLTPAFQAIYADANGVPLEDLQTTMSGAISDDEPRAVDGGLIEIPFPWEAVPFYGPHRVGVASIDSNYYDFLRTQGIQQGGVGFSPGEIPNVISHVEGGAGLFGSYAMAEFETNIRKSGSDDGQ